MKWCRSALLQFAAAASAAATASASVAGGAETTAVAMRGKFCKCLQCLQRTLETKTQKRNKIDNNAPKSVNETNEIFISALLNQLAKRNMAKKTQNSWEYESNK